MDIEIQKTRKEHLNAVYELVEELAVFEKARHEMTMTKKDYHQLYDENVFESIVAVQGDQVIGTCIFYDTFSTWKGRMLYLEDFVVRSVKRNSGVGQMLYDELLRIAAKKKCALVKWQVLDWNEPAIKFYKKNGATIEKEWWNCKVIL